MKVVVRPIPSLQWKWSQLFLSKFLTSLTKESITGGVGGISSVAKILTYLMLLEVARVFSSITSFGIIVLLDLLLRVSGGPIFIESSCSFSLFKTWESIRFSLALLCSFLQLIGSPFVNPWLSCLKSKSIIGRLVSIAFRRRGRFVCENCWLPEIFNVSRPVVFIFSLEEIELISVVFLNLSGKIS